jgi:glucuronoarabinoxylan endo-1,4-beta-xylanase
MKKFAAIAYLAIAFSFIAAWSADATVDLSREYQIVRGFGGMNHTTWIGDLTAAQRDVAFGNGNGQLGFTVLRIHVDENKNLWQREVATAKRAIELGALVFASPWNPPSDMVETFSGAKKRLKYNRYADYAQHLNDFVTYMKNNGVELYAISIQNEPDYDDGWIWWTGTEIVNFLKNNASSINCRIMAPESFQYVKSMSDPILNDAQALANMHILGAHLYGTQVSQFPYPLFKQKGAGKELWMTEVYHPNSSSDANTWPEALDVAVHVHRAMAEAEFQTYVWWYIRRSYGPMKEDGTISKRGYMMAHFSKFARQNYVRIEATKNPETDVFVSAYKGDGKFVIVAVNKKTTAVNQTFIVNGNSGQQVEAWRTSANENMAKIANITGTGSFVANLPAQSVTTFVGNSSTAINVTATCNVENLESSYAAGSSVPRPNVTCSDGTPGTASFSANGSEVTGWNAPGGTHKLYNTGTRTVTLSSVMCGSSTVSLSPPAACGSFGIEAAVTDIEATCNVENLESSYVAGSSVPRPNITCSDGVPGTASFSANGADITGWAEPGGTHELYNLGARSVILNSVACGTTTVTPSTPAPCGSFEIVESPIEITCDIENFEPSYVAGSDVPRPNATCSSGEPGTAMFIVRSPITGWAEPGGTHQFNAGAEEISLSELECGATNVILNPAISCGYFEIEENPTRIARVPVARLNLPATAEVYNLKGNKVSGSLPSGVYLKKEPGKQIVKFVVK